MAGIVAYAKVKRILLDCGAFESDRQLAAWFADGRIHPWRHVVPQAGSAEERVQATIGRLYDQFNQAGQNALALLVEVLRDNKEPPDECHRQLSELAQALAAGGVDLPAHEPLRDDYLRRLQAEVSQLSALIHIDPTAAERHLELAQVYTALLTLEREEKPISALEDEDNELPDWLMDESEKKSQPLSALDQLNRHDRLVLIGAPGSGKSTLLEDEDNELPDWLMDESEKKSQPLSALDQLNRHDRLVLIGAPGSGKSTFVDFVVMCMAGELLGDEQTNLRLLQTPLPQEADDDEDDEPPPQAWAHGALLPIKIELRRFVAEGLPPTGQVTSEQVWRYLSQQLPPDLTGYVPLLQQRLRERGGLVLFDGLDEIPNPDESCPRLKAVLEDMARCYPKCRLVVTSRPYAYQNPKWQLHQFAQATLANFSEGQIKQFIQGWYGYLGYFYQWNEATRQARASQLAEAIFSRHRALRPLAEKPLLLTLMVNLHASTGSLPEKRAELYEETVKLLLERWERGRLRANQSVITPRLSDYLQTNQARLRELLQNLALEAHANQPTKAADTANLDGYKLLSGLMKLAAKEVNPNELLEYLNQRAGILENVDSQGEGLYRFPHRTFQEYLAACALNGKPKSSKEIAKLVKAEPNRWREVALLAAATRDVESFWTLIQALCAKAVAGLPPLEAGDLMAALIAGQAIIESVNLSDLMAHEEDNEAEIEQVSRVRGWLEQLTVSQLPVLERVTAGQVLAKLGDERGGVGILEV